MILFEPADLFFYFGKVQSEKKKKGKKEKEKGGLTANDANIPSLRMTNFPFISVLNTCTWQDLLMTVSFSVCLSMYLDICLHI